MSAKEVLRKKLVDARCALDANYKKTASENVARHIQDSSLFSKSQNIACYLAHEGELDCYPLIKKIWEEKKNCYLPRLSENHDKKLSFVAYRENEELIPNKYKILEPQSNTTIAPEMLDLVIVPVVGFDLTGNRLGMGAGYYDATFSFLNSDENAKKCFLLGVGYAMQEVESLPQDLWDVKLNAIATEKTIIIL